MWNHFVSPFFKANVGVNQGSTLYIASIFHIFEKRTKNLLFPIQVSTLSFVDDGLLISQEKSYEKSKVNFFCSYNIISSSFNQFVSRTKEVDLVFFYVPFLFLFSFRFIFCYSIFRTRVRVRVTRSRCHTAGHIRWHGHKSHNAWKKVEGSGRITSYNVWNACWP